MNKQRSIGVTFDHFTDWLKAEAPDLPDDLEICNVSVVPGTTNIAIMVRSDTFTPTPPGHYVHSSVYLKDAMDSWKEMEQEWEQWE